MSHSTWCGVLLAGICLLAPAGVRAQTAEPIASGTNSVAVAKRKSDPLEGHWHSVTRKVSPKLPAICFCDKINPVWWFKNADEPVPPDWFAPGEKRRSFKWFVRNPFHNFTHYVIGIADKTYVRSGRYPEKVGNPNNGWNFAVAKYGLLRLPFISYRQEKFEFYFGWEVMGNFGIKFNINPHRVHPLQPTPQTGAVSQR
jgi:hypothetical protein